MAYKKNEIFETGFSFITLDNYEKRYMIKNQSVHSNYIETARYLADTINFSIFYYKDKYVKEKLNATHAVSISRSCGDVSTYWTNNKVVIIYKKNNCRIEFTYLYTDNAKKNIDKEIKSTEAMIRFK